MAPAAVQKIAAEAGERVKRELWNVEEAATYLGMSEPWVRKAARLGTIPSVHVGTSLKFRRESLDEWIEQQERKPAQSRKRRAKAVA